jgi:hypothetical protein
VSDSKERTSLLRHKMPSFEGQAKFGFELFSLFQGKRPISNGAMTFKRKAFKQNASQRNEGFVNSGLDDKSILIIV